MICSKILDNLAKLAEDNKDSVMAGRTHGKHATPITYGYKVSVWISDMLTSVERMKEVEKRVFKIMEEKFRTEWLKYLECTLWMYLQEI